MKRVLLIVVDGCTSRVLGPALDRGALPVLSQVTAAGMRRLDCVSIFPSITPAATASIVTGRYPSAHGIAGMSWWNPPTGTVVYFGDDLWTVLQRGIDDFLHGFLFHLSGDRLQTPTLFQIVEGSGRRAGCLNYPVFRGDVAHDVKPPLLFKILPSMRGRLTVHGPTWLELGDFVSSSEDASWGGMFDRFGFDDRSTEKLLAHLPRASALPDFTVAYFPDYDFQSHETGPDAAMDTLRRLDQRLGHVFDAWGGVTRVLDEVCIILTADHSHSQVDSGDGAGIALEELLDGYDIADPVEEWKGGDQLLLCPNMRAAEIYVAKSARPSPDQVARVLLADTRVDHVIWGTGDAGEFTVATADRGTLRFTQTDGADGVADEYGGRWKIDGELAAVDAVVEHGRVLYRTYPNALERIARGICDVPVHRLWVTARPGHEFNMQGQSPHRRGGSHGTLHELDSVVPLLVSDVSSDLQFHTRPRIVDVAPLCLRALQIDSPLPSLGAPHV